MKIRKNDNVLVIKGKDKGRQGPVQSVFPGSGKVLVEGINIVKRHRKAQGMSGAEIVEKELPVAVANVMLVCTHCQKPAKVSNRIMGDGSKGRICKNCEEVIE
jgi:large subunit ribosomal protein L24